MIHLNITAPKFIICGRTASGKNTLLDALKEATNCAVAKSCTTKPRRSPDDDDYIFLNNGSGVADSDKICGTTHNGYEYFLTRDMVDDCDVFILDPHGVADITAAFPEYAWHVIYVHGLSEEHRKQHYIVRLPEDKQADAEELYKERCLGEDDMFSEFDDVFIRHTKTLREVSFITEASRNIYSAWLAANDYTGDSDIYRVAAEVAATMTCLRRICGILDTVLSIPEAKEALEINLGLISTKDGFLKGTAAEVSEEADMVFISFCEFAELVSTQPEPMHALMSVYLSLPGDKFVPVDR